MLRPSRSTVIRVRHGEDVVQVVRDQDDGEPLLGEARHELEHLLGLRDPERGGRLVEDHEPGVPHHGAGHGDRLALAARERRHRLPDRLDRRHGEALHRLGRPLLHLRLLEPVEPVARLTAEVHVLDDIEVVAESEILVDDLDPEPRRSFGLWIWTGWPSKIISPLSALWMPAMHLISVDLPAPLSPTSAITSPARPRTRRR